MDINTIKKRELEILKYIDIICRENKINYFLDSGTLLGAIRHKGFIPWDDDIDIILKRADYEKLISILKRQNDYVLFHPSIKENSWFAFAKLSEKELILKEQNFIPKLGIHIDIFPLDDISENKIAQWIYLNKMWWLRGFAVFSSMEKPEKGLMRKLAFYPAHWIGHYRLNNLIDKLGASYKKDTSKCSGAVLTYIKYKVLEKSWFDDQCLVEFEGEYFPAPIGYDEYLTYLYGDYMIPPKEEDRVGHDREIN